MSNPDRQSKPSIARTEQDVQNWSFDETYKVLAVEPVVEYNNTLVRLQGDASGNLVANKPELITKVASPSTGVYYIGKAAPGSSTASAVWQIKKLDTNTIALDKTYADGVTTFTKIWDSRAGYTYS